MKNTRLPEGLSLITRQAWQHYKNGNFLEAKQLYELAASKISRHAFRINIQLCQKKLSIRHWNEESQKCSVSSIEFKPNGFDELSFDRPSSFRPRLKVASILDEFTDKCFASLVDLIRVSPKDWKQLLQDTCPDILLVESAWHGNQDQWLYGIASYQTTPHDQLTNIVKWCNKEGIPTVFWNKEDPVNFDRFRHRAPLFDYVFTTDSDCIRRYQVICPKARYIGALMFAANLDIQNPCRNNKRINQAFFAGSYYADEHPERRLQMDQLLRACKNYGLTIYDRMSDASPDQKIRFQFPRDLLPFVKDRISYQELCSLYSSYRIALNVNSINSSPTMFSRRIFEILASGTPVVSTPSLGVQVTFQDLVPICADLVNTHATIQSLFSDQRKWGDYASRGWRDVCRKHTYQDRLVQILETVGIPLHFIYEPQFIAILMCPGASEINKAYSVIAKSLKKLDLLVVPQTDDAFLYEEEIIGAIKPFCKVVSIPFDHVSAMIKADYPDAIVSILHSSCPYGDSYLEDVWHFSRRSVPSSIPASAICSDASEYSCAYKDFGYPLSGAIPAHTLAAKGDSSLIGEAIYKLVHNSKLMQPKSCVVYQRPRPE